MREIYSKGPTILWRSRNMTFSSSAVVVHVAKLLAGLAYCESPSDRAPVSVGVASPCSDVRTQNVEFTESVFPETLVAEHADLYFGLIEPAAMLGREVKGESAPKSLCLLSAERLFQSAEAVG